MFETAIAIEGYQARVEDRAEVIDLGPATRVLVVADGAGGRAGGEAAAERAVGFLRAAITSEASVRTPRQLCRLLSRADAAVLADADAGETTCVVVSVSARVVVGASVGDSEAWIVTADGYHDLTAGQQRKPVLGSGAAEPAAFRSGPLRGTLLAGSDGLFKYADAEAICGAVRHTPLAAAPERLVDLVRLRSGALWDDVSVLLCRAGP